MQSLYLEAINKDNLEYLTLDLLEFPEVQSIYKDLVKQGLSYEEIKDKLRNILDKQPKLSLKKDNRT